ncbi:restriction endonuclease subunit S [Holzapfeliella sp. JNUCC 72]
MNKERLVPQLRFKGFEGEWETERADQLFFNISSKNHIDQPVLSATQENGLVFREEVDKKINYDEKSLSSYKLVEPKDIVISLRSFQGGFEVSNKKGIVSPAYTIIRYKNHEWNPYFWKVFFKSYNFIQVLKKATYGIRDGKSISYKDFSSLKLNYTFPEEQQKIGSFFEKMDKLIELYNNKLVLKKNEKKWFLANMFVDRKMIHPKIRFFTFNDSWRNGQLGEAIYEVDKIEVDKPHNFQLAKVQLNFRGIKATDEHPRVTEHSRAYYFRNSGELMVGKQNFHNGGFGIAGPEISDYIASSAILSFLNKQNFDLTYIYYFMSRHDWLMRTTKYIGGTGQKEYSLKLLMQLTINFPSLPEQQKIGQLFQKLDQEINLYEQKIEQLKQLKKGYLQKLFC